MPTDKSQQFFGLFSDPAPALELQFSLRRPGEPTTLRVRHDLHAPPQDMSQQQLDRLRQHETVAALCAFCDFHDGFELCIPLNTGQPALIECLTAASIPMLTERYARDGDLAWVVDANATRAARDLYRCGEPWIAFAVVGRPSCLTTFLSGEFAGKIFLLAPEPGFNIGRPIAASFDALLHRIGKDVAAFLRLLRSTVRVAGRDGASYGLQAVRYVRDSRPPDK